MTKHYNNVNIPAWGKNMEAKVIKEAVGNNFYIQYEKMIRSFVATNYFEQAIKVFYKNKEVFSFNIPTNYEHKLEKVSRVGNRLSKWHIYKVSTSKEYLDLVKSSLLAYDYIATKLKTNKNDSSLIAEKEEIEHYLKQTSSYKKAFKDNYKKTLTKIVERKRQEENERKEQLTSFNK